MAQLPATDPVRKAAVNARTSIIRNGAFLGVLLLSMGVWIVVAPSGGEKLAALGVEALFVVLALRRLSCSMRNLKTGIDERSG